MYVGKAVTCGVLLGAESRVAPDKGRGKWPMALAMVKGQSKTLAGACQPTLQNAAQAHTRKFTA